MPGRSAHEKVTQYTQNRQPETLRPDRGVLLHELRCDGKGFHLGQHDMCNWHDGQHAPKPGDHWNDDGGMASGPQRHVELFAGIGGMGGMGYAWQI